MTRRVQKYTVTINSPSLGIINCGDLVIRELNGNIDGIGFRYSYKYLSHPKCFSIDPIALPLNSKAYQYNVSNKNLPGFLDDYLPDDWGKCVLTRAATVSKKLDFNAHSIIDILSLVSKSNIGALSIDEVGVKPSFALGLKISELYDAEIAAQLVIDPGANIDLEIAKLIHLWSVGSGAVGGARPKSLVHKKGNGFIAKFNKSTDAFDNARVELACLKMAKAAGINIFGGFVDSGYDQRNILLLERFDLVGNSRSHLVSINSLLKSPENFADYGMMFRYNNVHAVLKKYSNNIEQDVEQLFRQMLFNRAINNTDDHERNFSLINNGEGYQLSPAYDLVPSLTRGEYHAAGYEYSPFPPTPISIDGSRNIFGVRKIKTMEIAEQVIEATRRWMFFAELSGVSEKDADAIEAVLENE